GISHDPRFLCSAMPRSVFVMPETIHAPPVPVPVRGEATVPLASFVRPFQRHYFSGLPERPNYRARSYDFAGLPALMPLVRAFLDTCAATETADYRYLFTLLGSELANNAIGHSLSGHPGGAYTLRVHRNKDGPHLAGQARGGAAPDLPGQGRAIHRHHPPDTHLRRPGPGC